MLVNPRVTNSDKIFWLTYRQDIRILKVELTLQSVLIVLRPERDDKSVKRVQITKYCARFYRRVLAMHVQCAYMGKQTFSVVAHNQGEILNMYFELRATNLQRRKSGNPKIYRYITYSRSDTLLACEHVLDKLRPVTLYSRTRIYMQSISLFWRQWYDDRSAYYAVAYRIYSQFSPSPDYTYITFIYPNLSPTLLEKGCCTWRVF